MSKVFAIVGGDLRSVFLAKMLIEDNYCVKVYGLHSDIPECESIEEAISHADFVIGAIPFFEDSFYKSTNTTIESLFSILNSNQIFISGKLDDNIQILAKEHNIRIIDLVNLEEFAVQNAVPTAEGAIQIAMQELPITIHGAKVLVSGFGRIGKTLTKMLHGIGAEVYTISRTRSQVALAQNFGYNAICFKDISPLVAEMDIIFNTVPHMIFDKSLIDKMNKQCLIVDLSSKPFGVDFNYCEEVKIKAIIAPGLPGIVAPKTAALYIKKNMINELLDMGEILHGE